MEIESKVFINENGNVALPLLNNYFFTVPIRPYV